MTTVYLLLGGNIGDVPVTFNKATDLIKKNTGKINLVSPVYCSEPWGFESKNIFYNQVIQIETPLTPGELLKSILLTESVLGRERREGIMESRIIDIDILFYNGMVIKEQDLEIPHPRLHLRKFTLVPMADISPDLIHPVLGKTMVQLLDLCTDKGNVFPYK